MSLTVNDTYSTLVQMSSELMVSGVSELSSTVNATAKKALNTHREALKVEYITHCKRKVVQVKQLSSNLVLKVARGASSKISQMISYFRSVTSFYCKDKSYQEFIKLKEDSFIHKYNSMFTQTKNLSEAFGNFQLYKILKEQGVSSEDFLILLKSDLYKGIEDKAGFIDRLAKAKPEVRKYFFGEYLNKPSVERQEPAQSYFRQFTNGLSNVTSSAYNVTSGALGHTAARVISAGLVGGAAYLCGVPLVAAGAVAVGAGYLVDGSSPKDETGLNAEYESEIRQIISPGVKLEGMALLQENLAIDLGNSENIKKFIGIFVEKFFQIKDGQKVEITKTGNTYDLVFPEDVTLENTNVPEGGNTKYKGEFSRAKKITLTVDSSSKTIHFSNKALSTPQANIIGLKVGDDEVSTFSLLTDHFALREDKWKNRPECGIYAKPLARIEKTIENLRIK